MIKTTKIQKIKTFVKVSVAFGLIILFFVLGVFVKHTHSFENSNMKTWVSLSETQRLDTLHKIIPNIENIDLMLACMNKITTLPESSNMVIQSAASLCYNGIKLNEIQEEKQSVNKK